jgi:hypothetical protein
MISDIFSKLRPYKPLTKAQEKTIIYAGSLDTPFKTRDLARYIYPTYYFRNKVFVSKENKDMWARDPQFILDMYDCKDIKEYNFRRRAILTTSSRLRGLVLINCMKGIRRGKDMLWSLKIYQCPHTESPSQS